MSKIKLYKYVTGPKKEVHMYEAQAAEWIAKGILEEVKEVKDTIEVAPDSDKPKKKKSKKNKK